MAEFVRKRKEHAAAILLLLLATLTGCGSGPEGEQQSNLRVLSVWYGQYRSAHGGELPRNEEEFKSFIQARSGDALQKAGIASVEELFISSRDGKPFVVRYRDDANWPLENAVIYEQEGASGTRHIATPLAGYAEITNEEFRRQLANVDKAGGEN